MQDNAHTSNFISRAARASRTPMCSPAAGPPPPSVIALFTIGSSFNLLCGLILNTLRSSFELREEEEISCFWDHWKASADSRPQTDERHSNQTDTGYLKLDEQARFRKAGDFRN